MSVGIKKRVSDALEDAGGRRMTLGEVLMAADISKDLAHEVSSALHKLIGQGRIEVSMGPSTALRGRKLVRMYRWCGAEEPKRQTTAAGATVVVVQATQTVRRVFNF